VNRQPYRVILEVSVWRKLGNHKDVMQRVFVRCTISLGFKNDIAWSRRDYGGCFSPLNNSPKASVCGQHAEGLLNCKTGHRIPTGGELWVVVRVSYRLFGHQPGLDGSVQDDLPAAASIVNKNLCIGNANVKRLTLSHFAEQ
jgi:hypothetical protein